MVSLDKASVCVGPNRMIAHDTARRYRQCSALVASKIS